MKKTILSNVVLLRVFTIIMVVLGHSSILYVDNWVAFQPPTDSYFFYFLKQYIDVFQMPVFIFISGYVYCFNKVEKEKYNQFFPFLKSKFFRLMIPYLSVSLLYVIPIRSLINYDPYQGESIGSVISKHVFLGFDIGHLWYVQTLFNIFIIFYFIEKIIRKNSPWLNVSLFFSLNIVSVFTPNIFNLTLTLRYLLFFYLGYLVRELVSTRRESMFNSYLIVFFFLQLIGLMFSAFVFEESSIIIAGIGFIFNTIGSFFSCLFYYSLFTKISERFVKLHTNKLVSFIDRKSFGIYLFHSPLMYLVLYYYLDMMVNPYLTVLTLFIVMFIGSLCITSLIEKTEILNFILGKPRSRKQNKVSPA